ncbi:MULTISPECIES: hypothetical protein [Streptomyces]|uniref:hypothetical protein n=1 Tax=Streptomyces TaxID=1883 RepID=UPI001E4B19AE|nr:hypothetical protein [Streptomyces sp. MNU103]
MSYSIFLLRFVDGEVVELDFERFRHVTEPYVVAGGPEEGFSQLRAEDGGEADLYYEPRGGSGMIRRTALGRRLEHLAGWAPVHGSGRVVPELWLGVTVVTV